MTTAFALLNYGRMEKPVAKSQVNVDANPLSALSAAYSQWLPLANAIYSRKSREAGYVETLVSEATALLRTSNSIARLDQEGFGEFLEIAAPHYEAAGLFVTAAFNESPLTLMDGVFRYATLGHRLKAGKRIIAREGSEINFFGDYAEGDIINLGESSRISYHSHGGLHANFGTVISFGAFAENFSLAS